MKKLERFFAKWFGWNYEIDPNPYIRAMYYFYQFHEDDLRSVMYMITHIAVYKEDGEVVVHITSFRPGFVIGKAGRHINALEKYIAVEVGHEVKTKLFEDKLWENWKIKKKKI